MSSQGANNGPSQGAGSQFVKFSRGAAQRIAKAVRTVEAGDRGQPALTFEHPMPPGRKVFRVATFTGSWVKNTIKTVTFAYQTSTPNTAVATNLFANISVDCGERKCAIAKDGTAWFLIQAEC